MVTIAFPAGEECSWQGCSLGAGCRWGALACRTFFVSKIPLLEIIGSWHDNETISI